MRSRMVWLTLCFLAALPPSRLFAAGGDRVVLKQIRPVYPELALKMRVFGEIRLRVSILPDGRVSNVVFESGHPLLVNAAKEAVRQWKFASGPETTNTLVTVLFSLPQ